jgi:hypothetical protein
VGFRFASWTKYIAWYVTADSVGPACRNHKRSESLYLVAQKTVDTPLKMTVVPARNGAARSTGIKYIYKPGIWNPTKQAHDLASWQLKAGFHCGRHRYAPITLTKVTQQLLLPYPFAQGVRYQSALAIAICISPPALREAVWAEEIGLTWLFATAAQPKLPPNIQSREWSFKSRTFLACKFAFFMDWHFRRGNLSYLRYGLSQV